MIRFYCALVLLAAATPAAASAQSTAPSAPFRTTGSFFAISVSNLEAARAWYVDTLGLAIVMQPPPYQGINALILEGGGLIVELIHNPAAQARAPLANPTLAHGLFKIGIVVENLDATLQQLRARGVTLVFGPFPAQGAQRANFGIRDNSGTIIQFFGR